MQGQKKTFAIDGQPLTLEEWAANIQSGLTVVFENGSKRAEVPYTEGHRHGIEFRYNDDGTLAQEISWVRGEQHGPTRTYIGGNVHEQWFYNNQASPAQSVNGQNVR